MLEINDWSCYNNLENACVWVLMGWFYVQELVNLCLCLMIIMLRYVMINYNHEKYSRLHELWWIKIGVNAC